MNEVDVWDSDLNPMNLYDKDYYYYLKSFFDSSVDMDGMHSFVLLIIPRP
jgi:hypothetical protein